MIVITAQCGSFAELRTQITSTVVGSRSNIRCAKTVPTSVAKIPLRPGIRRASTATRPSSPTRPGRVAFANSPTQNAEKTSRNPGRGAVTASRITVFQAAARTTTEQRFRKTARTIHGQLTEPKVSRTRCQSGPRHQISEIATANRTNGDEQAPAAPFHTGMPS